MSRPYSNDLRERVVTDMSSGRSARAAAARFGVSVATAVRWSQRYRRTGGVAPGKIGGHRKPILLPATVEFGEQADSTGIEFSVRGAGKGTPHLDGRVSFR